MNRNYKKVILESPFAGDVERNIDYARKCVKDSLMRRESPIASHLLYTQKGILNDEIEEERRIGIEAGLCWAFVADLHVFYCDFGLSNGMKQALKYAEENNIPYEFRRLYGE